MEWVEVTAKSVAEAKDKALDYLGIDDAQAEFEVLEEPRVGLFKRVKGEARVRARIKPTVPRPKAERRDRRRGRSRDGGGASGGRGERPDRGQREAAGGDGAGREGGERDRPLRREGAGGRGERQPTNEGSRSRGRSGSRTEREGATRGPDGGTGGRGRGDGDDRNEQAARSADEHDQHDQAEFATAVVDTSSVTGAAAGDPRPSSPAQREPDSREEPENMSDEPRSDAPADDGRQTEHAVEFLSGLVAAFGATATVTSEEVDELYDEVRVEGSDLGLLIGQRAATLDSVQELARVVAQRRSGGRGESRLRVDIGGYRQRRREALERFARQLADEVKSSGKTKALEPMSSADRKVVHDVVGTIDGVNTLSEGEDPRRRVVIVPAGD